MHFFYRPVFRCIAPPDDRVIEGTDILEVAFDSAQSLLNGPLFWRSGGDKVVQQDGWKLKLKLKLSEYNGKTWLFNLNEDPLEQRDLTACYTEEADELRRVFYSMDDQPVEP